MISFQTFVMSKASFGWVGKWPTQDTTNTLFGRLAAALDSSRGAARQLPKLFYGAIRNAKTPEQKLNWVTLGLITLFRLI